jgi:uncharacterized glyoxalase superfamily protein PhnB
MAQSTWLQLVSNEEIHELGQNPSNINALDKADHYRTHFGASLNYFLTGEAYPSTSDHALWAALDGAESIACATLENAAFAVVSSEQAAKIATGLAAVDLAAVEAAIRLADFDDLLDDQELYDLELITPDEATGIIVAEIQKLTSFYAKAADAGLGVVMYTT